MGIGGGVAVNRVATNFNTLEAVELKVIESMDTDIEQPKD